MLSFEETLANFEKQIGKKITDEKFISFMKLLFEVIESQPTEEAKKGEAEYLLHLLENA